MVSSISSNSSFSSLARNLHDVKEEHEESEAQQRNHEDVQSLSVTRPRDDTGSADEGVYEEDDAFPHHHDLKDTVPIFGHGDITDDEKYTMIEAGLFQTVWCAMSSILFW